MLKLVCKEGVGNATKMLPKLESALESLPFAFCGPPGVGKKHLLQQLAAGVGKELILYDLTYAANENGVRSEDLRKVLSKYQTSDNLLGKGCVLALYGGEHLNEETAQMLKNKKVIIVANERTQQMKNAFKHTVWAPRLTQVEMAASLRVLCPAASKQAVKRACEISNGDLRQAQLQVQYSSSSVTKDSHVYFDVQDALCKGMKKDLDYCQRNWVSENHCQINKECEDHAVLSERLVLADLYRDTDIADTFTGLATNMLTGLRKKDFQLQVPHTLNKQSNLKKGMMNLFAQGLEQQVAEQKKLLEEAKMRGKVLI